jgi:enoyl-[acyl-carrier protein] reductase I
MPAEDFLQLAGRSVLVMGLANRKSVAWHVGQVLEAAGAEVLYTVHTEQRRQQVAQFANGQRLFVCDVSQPAQISALAEQLRGRGKRLYGLVHSIAFADYSQGVQPFYETSREAFLQSIDVSCYSLIAVCRELKDLFEPDGAVVAISISTTRMASENYGFMAPVKAALDSALVFLAKSFSSFSRVRFNAVAAGLLKTASSAGIPGYADAYLYAEQATLRKQALRTEEVSHAVAFLLSPRSSGINAQRIVVDAGMEVNYFDRDLIRRSQS